MRAPGNRKVPVLIYFCDFGFNSNAFANYHNDVRLRDVHGSRMQPGSNYHNESTILGLLRNLRISDQPCPLLDCPREIRDQIYAEVLLDFPTPSLQEQLACAMLGSAGPLCERKGIGYALRRLKRTHKIETNILLTNRQVFSEGKEIMLRRGRLVRVTLFNTEIILRLSSCELCLIDAKYRSLCVMTYECKCSWQTPNSSRASELTRSLRS